ncbi:hypothetical protein [Paracoccus endophyticus]|uniref:hypothetical protein n=1 Tax=Paracoccus endophyticus TaxID=2233774 RepID=UPI000DD87489|nr:hypothetical protein [Paracoccus endophyticus]
MTMLTRAALALLLTAGTAAAQGTAATADPGSPAAVALAGAPVPTLEQMANNEAVAGLLLAQGFRDVEIDRDGVLMTVTAQRDGVPVELVYNTSTGRLIEQDGRTILSPEDLEDRGGSTGAGTGEMDDDGEAGEEAAGQDGSADDATGEEGMDGEDGAAEGSEDGAAEGDGDAGESSDG